MANFTAYSTVLRMLNQYGAKEMAEVAGPRDLPPIPSDVFRDFVNDGETLGDITGQTKGVEEACPLALARIENALLEATGTVNSYVLSGGYQIPLSDPPEYIIGIEEDIARYMLHRIRPPEHVQKRYDDAIKKLNAIATKKMIIADADGVPDPSATSGASVVAVGSTTQVFTDATLDQFS